MRLPWFNWDANQTKFYSQLKCVLLHVHSCSPPTSFSMLKKRHHYITIMKKIYDSILMWYVHGSEYGSNTCDLRHLSQLFLLHVHPSFMTFIHDNYISLSSFWKLIWRHWTTKMLVNYWLPSVCLRLRQLSQLSFIQYMGLCIFSLPNSPVMIVRMCILSYYHHQIGSMSH